MLPPWQLHTQVNAEVSHSSFWFCAQEAVKRGAVSVREPWEETDENGTVTFATVKTVSLIINIIYVILIVSPG